MGCGIQGIEILCGIVGRCRIILIWDGILGQNRLLAVRQGALSVARPFSLVDVLIERGQNGAFSQVLWGTVALLLALGISF